VTSVNSEKFDSENQIGKVLSDKKDKFWINITKIFQFKLTLISGWYETIYYTIILI